MTEALRPLDPEPRSGVVAFRPRARLLKLIGSELISDEVLAITELVKNAHDADASSVVVEFSGVTGPDGWIEVRDDGHGMDLRTLLENWMEPAGTSKAGPGGRRTGRGRRMLGEKGVGRFAADKLARHLELVSRRPGSREGVRASFDWDEFETDSRMLSEITSRWEVTPAREVGEHGTILRMTGLRTRWNERMFRRLATKLSRLRSPFAGADGFSVAIDSDEFPEYAGELRPDILDRAPYRIDAAFDGTDGIETRINGGQPIHHRWNGGGPLACGPVRVRLFAFDLETDALARIGPRLEVRAWLREWSGVSVYRDGFRIWPYGEPHDDWLRLDQRRVNNPVVRLSNNQVVGFVEITRDGNPGLMDQTNREGLIHNRALDDLRRLLYLVLQLVEAERQAIRHPSGAGDSRGMLRDSTGTDLEASLRDLAARAPEGFRRELGRLAAVARESSRGAAPQQRVVGRYAELAAAGQIAMGLGNELLAVTEQMADACQALRSGLPRHRPPAVTAALQDLELAVDGIARRLSAIRDSEEVSRGARRTLDLAQELDVFSNLVRATLRQRGGSLRFDLYGEDLIRIEMRPGTLHGILHILANNALDWSSPGKPPEIRIVARCLDHERCELMFSDSGPGIPQPMARRVFEPGFSCKEGGRGMGLSIARELVERAGGQIEVVTDRRRRGATMRIVLPRKRPKGVR